MSQTSPASTFARAGRRRIALDHHLLRPHRDRDRLAGMQHLVRIVDGERRRRADGRRRRARGRSPGPRHGPSRMFTSPTNSAMKRVLRLLVDLARRRHLHDAAVVHDRDAVGHGHGLLLVVGDDHEGHAELVLDVHELELGLLAQLLVERARAARRGAAPSAAWRARARAPRAGAGRRRAGSDSAWQASRAARGAASRRRAPRSRPSAARPACRPKAMFFSTLMCGKSA